MRTAVRAFAERARKRRRIDIAAAQSHREDRLADVAPLSQSPQLVRQQNRAN